MTAQQIRDTFLIQDADRRADPNDPATVLPYYADPVGFYGQSLITPLIDGDQYFAEIFTQIESLTVDPNVPDAQGVLLMNWYCDENYQLPAIAGSPYSGGYLDAALVDLVQRGFDVRVLLWVNDYTLSTDPNELNERVPGLPFLIPDDAALATSLHWSIDTMIYNIQTVFRLRNTLGPNNNTPLASRVIMDTLGHPLGSTHVKMALVYDADRAIGFTGGFDFGGNRNSSTTHDPWNAWHDVGAKVEGEVVVELHTLFRSVWNELLTQRMGNPLASPTFLFNGQIIEGTPLGLPPIAPRFWPGSTVSGNIVQSVRTIPDRASWPWLTVPGEGWAPEMGPLQVPKAADDISFAPDGLFEIHLALKKLISEATKYIYIEDQAMHSSIILDYVRERLIAHATVKVILLTGGYSATALPSNQIYSLNRYLFENLSPLAQSRVKLFKVMPAYVHSKVVIVDDKAAYVGSAGLFNRAMSVSLEHGVVFIDSADDGTRIRDFRVQLWAEHFQIDPAEVPQLEDIDKALGVWNPWVGTGNASFKLPQHAFNVVELTSATRSFVVLGGTIQVDVPRSLVAFEILPGTPLTAENDPAYFLAGDNNSITDAGLLTDNVWDLTGGAIHVFDGPNAGMTLPILSHQNQRIFVPVVPQPFDNTTRYLLLQPYIRDFEIRPVVFNAGRRLEYGFTELSFL